MNMKHLNECFEPGFQPKPNDDLPPTFCQQDDQRFRKGVAHPLNTKYDQNEGLGVPVQCDPMTTGKIVNDPHKSDNLPNSTIYRYAKGLRGADEAVKGLFENIDIIDINSKVYPVPIIWGSQERAVAVAIQENVRKDNSLVVDRIILPIMSIYTSSHSMNNDRYLYHGVLDYRRDRNNKPTMTTQEKRHPKDTVFGLSRGIPVDLGYTLTIWTRYWEDMNEILEQIYLKFSGGIAYIRIQGVTNWETIVKLDSIASNINMEPGDKQERIIKFQINMTAETFIPQPIARRKAVLKSNIDIVDGVEIDEIQNVINKIEEAVEGLGE